MRDANRYLTELFRVRPLVLENRDGFEGDWVRAFADAGLVPIMLALKLFDADAFASVVQKFEIEPLYHAFSKSEAAMEFMDATWGSYIKFEEGKIPSDEDRVSARHELLEALIYMIWCKDRNNSKYQHSYQVLIRRSWGFNSLPRLAKII